MRAIILVFDSFGIGAAPDADRFGDAGSDTLGHIAEMCAAGKAENGRSGPLKLPNLERLGLGLANKLATGRLAPGFSEQPDLIGAYAAAREISSGKDTPSGHWELTGVPVRFEWGYFRKETDTFPPDLLDRLVKRGKLLGYLGNCHASGTEIIARLGEEHMRTGKPIFYTSADSVFQIACHEESFGLKHLYELCQIAREEVDRYNICRVIARPFVGRDANSFVRTGNRHDLAVKPPADTLLKKLADAGGEVVSIGKIADIFADVGITRKFKATGLPALWESTIQAVEETRDFAIVMTNFVDFDQNYGHRRDVSGYAAGLEFLDSRLPGLYERLRKNDMVVITADHGCDPTWRGSDHTREHVPILAYGGGVKPGSLGIRDTFADLGQSLAAWFGLAPFPDGRSFLAGNAGVPVDVEELLAVAIAARESAYAPYSKFKVGAALLAKDGRMFRGCNVENASYGLSNCAERTAFFSAVAAGCRPGDFAALAIAADTNGPVTPCGACRQVIVELGSPDLKVVLANTKGEKRITTAIDLLPDAFVL